MGEYAWFLGLAGRCKNACRIFRDAGKAGETQNASPVRLGRAGESMTLSRIESGYLIGLHSKNPDSALIYTGNPSGHLERNANAEQALISALRIEVFTVRLLSCAKLLRRKEKKLSASA